MKSVAEELNVNYHTIKNGMKRTSDSKVSEPTPQEKRPQDGRTAEPLTALQESHALSGESLNAGVERAACLPVT